MFNAKLRVVSTAAVFVALLALAGAVHAGPPLICHPFDAGSAPLLPWEEGQGWNTPDPAYDVRQLTPQVLQLLAADAPVLARMENLRRATIYAAQDPRIAAQLLTAVLQRVANTGEPDADDALAWFDAGYLLESYQQASWLNGWNLFAAFDRSAAPAHPDLRTLDGYRITQKALELAGSSPEMHFAASLMTSDDVAAAEHRRRAADDPGFLLLLR